VSQIPEELKIQRMNEDADMIRHPDRWPGAYLHLKTQPWISPRRFGVIKRPDLETRTVRDKESGDELSYASFEHMTETWSVD
jgi:hypothetical protein